MEAGDHLAERATLGRERRVRRRRASACFFAAGIGFGTALYLLRVHFNRLLDGGKGGALLALVAITVLLFYIGARAETELARIDERLRELDERERR